MKNAHYYDVNIEWESDRKGVMSSPAIDNTFEVATPPEFPKGIQGIWSPEHLLVGAVNSCLMTTFLAIAENSQLNFLSFNSKGSGKLETIDGKLIVSEITLEPEIVISDEGQRERAERILQKSEAACLISNSIKSKVIFNPHVIVLEEPVHA
jgi:peroxiredoxin-like protein